MTATRIAPPALRLALLVAAAAGWAVAAYFLWTSSTLPDGLRLPEVDPHAIFGERLLRRAGDFASVERWLWVASTAALLVTFALYAWRGAAFARESAAGPIGTGMLLGMLGFAILWLVELPFTLVELWWQRRYGLSDAGYLEYVLSGWLALAGEFLFLCFTLLVAIGLARLLGRRWWVVGGPVFVGVAALFLLVQPYLVPTGRVADAQVVADARRIARAEGVGGIPLRVQDVSDRTDTVNAYADGLGPSREVVLWSTVLDGRLSRGEVDAILAHEYAHHARGHLPKGLAWYALFALPGAFLIERLTRRRGGMAEPTAVPLSLLVVVCLQLAATPLQNAVSRRVEAEADWSALQTTRDPAAAAGLFAGFTREGLAEPSPPTWSYLLLQTHPTIEQRVAMARAWRARHAAATARGRPSPAGS